MRALPDAALGRLSAVSSVRFVPPDTTVIDRGDAADEVYFVLSGELHGEIRTNGKAVLIDSLGPGAVFGELSALTGQAHVFRVLSQSDAQLAAIPTPTFDQWLMDHPEAMRALLADISNRMRILSERLYEVAWEDVQTRVRTYLVRKLKEIGALHDGGILVPAPRRTLIAASIGSNREAVSRALSRCAKDGMISVSRRRIVVLNARRLEHGVVAIV